MTIEAELFTYLTTTNATVSGIIGTRMYPGVIAQDATRPALAYTRISTNRVQSLEGSSDLPMARFQFSSFASTPVSAVNLSEAVRGALNDFSGAMGAITVQCINLVDEGDLPPSNTQDSKRKTYGRRLDFIVNYNEDE